MFPTPFSTTRGIRFKGIPRKIAIPIDTITKEIKASTLKYEISRINISRQKKMMMNDIL